MNIRPDLAPIALVALACGGAPAPTPAPTAAEVADEVPAALTTFACEDKACTRGKEACISQASDVAGEPSTTACREMGVAPAAFCARYGGGEETPCTCEVQAGDAVLVKCKGG